jgi:hypothetical protein
MRWIQLITLLATASCHYAGPLSGATSDIREGTVPDRVKRFVLDEGGARAPEAILPPNARDSAAIFLVAVDQRALGVAAARVAVLPHNESTPKYPKEGWQKVDSFGVYSQRFGPGEYMVFVDSPFHWSARKLVQLRAGSVDTLLAVMRNGAQQGDRAIGPFPGER